MSSKGELSFNFSIIFRAVLLGLIQNWLKSRITESRKRNTYRHAGIPLPLLQLAVRVVPHEIVRLLAAACNITGFEILTFT